MTLSQIPSPPAGKPANTLADLLERLDSAVDLDDPRRRDFQGAIRTLCKVLARPAQAIPSDPRHIDQLLKEAPVGAGGISRKTLDNVRSRLKAALRHGQSTPKLPPRGTPLSPEWQALNARLDDLRLRHGLSRLIRVASHRGLAPTQVNDDFLGRLVDDVRRVNWERDALPFWRQTVALWNEAAASIDGWPQVTLTPPPASPRRQHLPLEDFPMAFRNDLEAYLQWAAGDDPLASDAPNTSLKAGTLRLRREQLRVAASTLAQQQGSPAAITGIAVLVMPENAKAILTAYLNAAKDRKPTEYIRGLASMLVTVARHWVKVPEEQLQELLRMKRKLGSTPSGLTDKNRRVVGECSDPEVLRQLLNLPDVLRKQAHTLRLTPARRLQKMQMALAIELLLVAPMRLQNLAALRIGHQLQWPSGRTGDVWITLRRDETKNEQPLEYPVEGHARDLLHEYLDRYRAYAKGAESDWLFVHLDGTPVSDAALRDGITKATKRELGVAITPHQFRHLVAAITLDHTPGAIGTVRDLLGHSNIKTTVNFYAGRRTRQAAREWSKILGDARRAEGGSA